MNRFSNLKIRTKLLVSFIFISCIALLVGITGLTIIRMIADRDAELYNDITVPITKLTELAKTHQRMRVDANGLMMARTDVERQQFAEKLEEKAVLLDSINQSFGQSVKDDRVAAAFSKYKKEYNEYARLKGEFITHMSAGEFDLAYAQLTGDTYQEGKDVETAINELIDVKVLIAAEKADLNGKLADRAFVWLITLLGAGVLAALGLGLVVARLISRPVVDLQLAALKVAEGDLEVSARVNSHDEVGSLTESFNTMVQKIRHANQEIIEEKRGVEQKVADGVRESEQKAALLNRMVDRLSWMIGKLAEGDLTARIDLDGFGRAEQDLFSSFNRSVETIGEMIAQVNHATAAAADASLRISASGVELASASQEQSSQTNEVSAAVEEMVRTIVENSRSATHAAELAGEAGRVALEGGEVVKATVRMIHQMAEGTRQSARAVELLGSKSQEIGDIVGVISDIAEMTNLLALNAAIEAARAGDQGRGFAVVADEVRKLAERTTLATKEITTMIRGVQTETDQVTETIRNGEREVNSGIQLADRAGFALEQVVVKVQATVDTVTQIAAASEQQSTTSEQIARSVDMISQVSHESAHGVNRIAQSADDLTRLTGELKKLVSRFNLGSNDLKDKGRSTPSRPISEAFQWN